MAIDDIVQEKRGMFDKLKKKITSSRTYKAMLAAGAAGALSLACFPSDAKAAAFDYMFSGESEGGTGSAKISVEIQGDKLYAEIYNLSPIEGGNYAGITGFGFDLNDSLGLESWSMQALEDPGSSPVDVSNWLVGDFLSGVRKDYIFWSKGRVRGGLYNPEGEGGEIPRGPYFTTASLMLDFDRELGNEDLGEFFVRMQNVGFMGEGSLKLYDDTPSSGAAVPEPASVLLLGSGLGYLALVRMRNRKKNMKNP